MVAKYVLKRMALVFDEWAKRYAANPESFSEILDDKGDPVTGYGHGAAVYFNRLAAEMDDEGLLPRPPEEPKETA